MQEGSWCARFAALTAGMLLSAGAVCAQSAHDFATYRPTAQATRIDAREAPVIDGDISDPVWRKAKPIDQFYEIDPQQGAVPAERTVVRVLYDENNLYFAIRADDPAPVTARVKQRDGSIDSDDAVRIILDPDMTRRNGYVFDVNPLGARREGLIQNNTDLIYQWNTLWSAKATITSQGWQAEIAIPFRSISYGTRAEWGFDFVRQVRRKSEIIRWSSINKVIASQDISHSGTLAGIEGIRPGIGLDVQAFALARYERNWDAPHDGSGISFRPSGNIFYKITPSLTGTLTYNTDFSDAPLDQRKVNISRFNLFYPERRDFFLQDAAAFEFGGEALNVNMDPNGAPFFTRRIGIVNDSPVNMLGGAKLSGTYDDFGIGALSVMTAGGEGVGEQLLSAARVTMPVLEESKLGLMVTNGNPTGESENTLTGADFQFHKSDLFGDKIVKGDAYFERSYDSKLGNGNSFAFNLDFPNEPWKGLFRFKQVDENFNPALGWVARPGIRDYTSWIAYRARPEDSYVRWWEVGFWDDAVTGLDNKAQTVFHYDPWFGLYTQDGDYFFFEAFEYTDRVPAFDLPHDIVVPAGSYTNPSVHFRTETATARFISGIFDLQYGAFYGGKLLQIDTTVNLNPNDTFALGLRHITQQISVPNGNVSIHVASIDTSVNFTPDMQLRGQLQYDNISKNLELSFRYRWELQPGTELLVVLGDDATLSGRYYQSHASTLSVRLGKTFRF